MPTVPGGTPRQAVLEVKGLLFRGRPDVVDADLADYFGSTPHVQIFEEKKLLRNEFVLNIKMEIYF
jgi:hypothetical protein